MGKRRRIWPPSPARIERENAGITLAALAARARIGFFRLSQFERGLRPPLDEHSEARRRAALRELVREQQKPDRSEVTP